MMIEDDFYVVHEQVRNFVGVFDTISSRPQLIFEDIKYCVIDSDNALPEYVSSLLKVHLLTRSATNLEKLTTGKVLLGNGNHQSFVAARTESSFLVAVFDSIKHETHCSLYVNRENSICKLKITSKAWDTQSHESINSRVQKLVKWLTADNFQFKPSPNSAVCPKQYYETYNRLKESYADSIFNAWDMQTDPSKFIHEDIGIASYLICIWRTRYGEKAQDYVNFVDVGCGNGLLVYLLNQEKYNGIGIDVKSRNIWYTLFSGSTFYEKFFDPKKLDGLSNYNWLIGNHSDELTPWLPYVASMISYRCDFFVLPCCPWNFSARYSRTSANVSTYQCYLNFVESVVSDFGFEYVRDVMKIPSTKRTCFISTRRSYSESALTRQQTHISDIIRQHSGNQTDVKCVERSKEIKVRNGSKLDKVLCSKIVDFTASLLLMNVSKDQTVWSAGESIHIKEVISAIKQSIDFGEALKNQDGGIQTVLRNFHQLFMIKGGVVSLRDWSKEGKRPKSLKKANRKYDSTALKKSKLCWFHENHPQGCNLTAEACNYAHGSGELREVNFMKD